MDFAKAFDKVPHYRLLEKVEKHGISGRLLHWLNKWLTGRRQRVCIKGHKSTWREVTSSIPQGSVLGPVLFLLFINDLDTSIVSSILKFADDTKLFGIVNDTLDRDIIQQDLHQLVQWSEKWQMPFNASKCVVLHLGSCNKEFNYCMGNTTTLLSV